MTIKVLNQSFLKYSILLLSFFISAAGTASDDRDMFTIYLVRHAEKGISSESPENPPLKECGTLRAKSLSTFFKGIQLDNIYSTDFVRTMSTATPTAESQKLDIEIYDPHNLDEIYEKLLERKQDALVIGHSDTTSILAGLLAGQKSGAFAENIYDRVYQVVISNSSSRINLLHQTFICNKKSAGK